MNESLLILITLDMTILIMIYSHSFRNDKLLGAVMEWKVFNLPRSQPHLIIFEKNERN